MMGGSGPFVWLCLFLCGRTNILTVIPGRSCQRPPRRPQRRPPVPGRYCSYPIATPVLGRPAFLGLAQVVMAKQTPRVTNVKVSSMVVQDTSLSTLTCLQNGDCLVGSCPPPYRSCLMSTISSGSTFRSRSKIFWSPRPRRVRIVYCPTLDLPA